MQLSIIICTHNRPDLLRTALASVCMQTLDADQYEVVVVDNASSQPIEPVVDEVNAKHPQHTLRYMREETLGLAHARNAGVHAATGQYVGFLDDDARADKDWARLAVELLTTQTPSPDCVGGVIEPYYTEPKPAWFDDAWERRTWGNEPRALQRGETFSGSNMIWRKQTLTAAGGFPTNLGVSGEHLALGEESAVFARLWQDANAPVLWYDPALRVKHWTPTAKLAVRYRLKRFFARGISVGIMKRSNPLRRVALLLVSLVAVVVHLIIAVLRVPLVRPWQRWMVVALEGAAARAGMVVALLGMNPTMRQP